MKARKLDKFYTRPDVAQVCLDHLLGLDLDITCDAWLEPSAGSGAFYSLLPEPRIGLDLLPEHPEVKKQNFLTWKTKKRVITIGNPPFGKNSALAVHFFNHAAQFSTLIAFIVPKTFAKDSVQKRLNPYFHLISSLALEPDSFTFQSSPYKVPCVFQIWQKHPTERTHTQAPLHHPDFIYTCKETACVAIQRVGTNAGRVKSSFLHLSPNSHYFLTSHTLTQDALINRLMALDYSSVKHNTAGNPSISKRELVALYNEKYG